MPGTPTRAAGGLTIEHLEVTHALRKLAMLGDFG